MIKLDYFLSKKKEPAQVLDLSRTKITSKDDFKRCLDKIPECKAKPEKILPEQVKVKEKEFTFVSGKKEEKHSREWSYPDPIPPDMKGVKLEDICPINIDWKMLTTLRPKSKVEEDFFSRLVQLGKLDLKYQQSLQRQKTTDWIRRTKNPKSSIIEMRVISCKECGEDFCDGSVCSKLTYENFFRPQPTTTNLTQGMSLLSANPQEKSKKFRKKRKLKRKKKSVEGDKGQGRRRKKKLGKSSIFNWPASAGCTRDHSRGNEVKVEKKHSFRASSTTRSFSPGRPRSNRIPKRSKSAPRIQFDCDLNLTGVSDFKRRDWLSDSAPSNTDYSSQSEAESDGRELFSPRLRLSGRRKLLSARVSFAERKRPKERADAAFSKFIRQCTLCNKHHFNDSKKFSTKSEFSSPGRYRNLIRPAEKVSSKFSTLPFKLPSTIQIQLDEEFSTLDGKCSKIALPMTPFSLRKKNWTQKKQIDSDERKEDFFKSESQVDNNKLMINNQEPGKLDSKNPTRKSKPEKTFDSLKRHSKITECCLKAKGIFGKHGQC